jgi:cardiolipin synthase
LGIEVEGSLARQLALSFEEMFARAEFRHKRFIRIRRTGARRQVDSEGERLLLSGPGWGWNPIKRSLRQDLVQARNVQIIAAYFLPTWRIRRDLVKIARRGGNVQIILPAKSDVEVSRLAAQSLYRRLLRSGIRIYEYQPQVLHAKLIIIDDAVYVGSANLDQRSLNINYELMVRLEGEEVRMKASQLFGERLKYCEEITRESWRRSRSLWARAKQRWAYWVLVRLDPLIARWQLRTLPD